ncbi:hypothetical protein N482_22015 [Pseudoalteromonas luteoviolacea NCIMB 1942]|uniref:Uncharacterized protein n=1 Tax=Pseudoalteromonas luteoviolacea NCIMB 1942 TaxID=1365253 RepID=A0A167HSX2_9GAMM|nr:DUF6653 family protein [Pseudoalteromonas luteoviolacea]KZN58491.1 hypothetical protein N482_22015 [Pseudoalteromonas luteoviolacea NCIMB 1942]
MKFENFVAKYFAMSDDVWACHANPWSVWTRYSCLPLLVGMHVVAKHATGRVLALISGVDIMVLV